ncbi:MAG: lysophospholipid acyltransferase family protein [Bryobacteraceae bacterium]
MTRLRAVLFTAPLIILSTIFFGLISVAISFFDKTGDRQIRVARAWARSLLLVSGIRVTVEGLEHIRPDGSYVLASNHASYMDTPVVMASIPVQFRFLAKRGLFQIPLLGTHLGQAGHIPVPREDPRASVKTMQLAAETIVRRHISMLIFPEGGRSLDGVLQPFKEGAAYIAIRAGAPIVPLVLIGTHDVLPMHSSIVCPGRVTLRILPPIETVNLTLKNRGRLTEQLHELIGSQLSK